KLVHHCLFQSTTSQQRPIATSPCSAVSGEVICKRRHMTQLAPATVSKARPHLCWQPCSSIWTSSGRFDSKDDQPKRWYVVACSVCNLGPVVVGKWHRIMCTVVRAWHCAL